MDFPGGSDGKASAYDAGDLGSIPGSGRFPGEGNGNPLQYSCLENPMDRGAWCRLLCMGHKESGMTEWLHFHFTSLYGVKMNEITSTILKIFRVKDGELKTNMFSIWDSIGLFRELNIIPSKPWLKLIGHQWSIFSKAGDCMLRCIICTLPIYWSIIYLSLCYTYRYMYAYTRIKKLCTMYMIDNIMCLLFSITIY